MTVNEERKVIEGYKSAIISRLPYMESDDTRRAHRTIKCLNRQLDNIGRNYREVPKW
jgi:hypothetical protein